jgi:hypothetical protein
MIEAKTLRYYHLDFDVSQKLFTVLARKYFLLDGFCVYIHVFGSRGPIAPRKISLDQLANHPTSLFLIASFLE